MKVLWVVHGGEVYGEKRAVVSLMKGMRSLGWHIEAISLTHGECTDALEKENLPYASMEIGDSPGFHRVKDGGFRAWEAVKMVHHQFPVARRVAKEIRARQPDIVHVLDKNILPAVAWAAKREGKTCCWEMTSTVGDPYPFHVSRRMHQWLVRRFNIHPIANSHYTAKTLENVGRPVHVMHLGADEEQFRPRKYFDTTRASLGIPEGAPTFVIVARMDWHKGQMLFMKGMLESGNPDCHLVLVGAMPGDAHTVPLREVAKSLHAVDRVHFISHTLEPQPYIAMADVAVNARIDAEPFGLSIIEAMMMGKPVLVHALGGPAETVLDAQTGWHVERASVNDFAAGVRQVLADRERWNSMGEAAHARAASEFSLKSQAQRYEAIVSAITQSRQNSVP